MNRNQGLVKFIIILIIVAVVLGYFGINLRSMWNSGPVQDNLGFLWESAKYIWQNYLARPWDLFWGFFYNYIWLSFVENLERLKLGENPNIIENLKKFPLFETNQ